MQHTGHPHADVSGLWNPNDPKVLKHALKTEMQKANILGLGSVCNLSAVRTQDTHALVSILYT